MQQTDLPCTLCRQLCYATKPSVSFVGPKYMAKPEPDFYPNDPGPTDGDITPYAMRVFQSLLHSQSLLQEDKAPATSDQDQLVTLKRLMTTSRVQPECKFLPTAGLKMTSVAGSARGLCDNFLRPSRPRSGDGWLPDEEDLATPLHRLPRCCPPSFAVPGTETLAELTLKEEQQCCAPSLAVPATAISPKLAPQDEHDLCQIHESPAPKKCSSSKTKRGVSKIWCHLFIDQQLQRLGFDFNKKVIGVNGTNTKRIFELTAAKIRLRGRGSGHGEMGRQGVAEANVSLMLAVAADLGNEEKFVTAVQMSAQLLSTVSDQYLEFCRRARVAAPLTPLFWIGELSKEARACIGIKPGASSVNLGSLELPVASATSNEKRRGGL
eukprot:TRINITY_DN17848_c0_g1_i1.p1 TRINITY_DN17848_c0_g1~~TRINITY_DN17848_c0_g1_i1.p1  ORF type:complete len:380 (-),score=65.52 TRINITY_DN17848_c0_g1_i1:466-1605(-)